MKTVCFAVLLILPSAFPQNDTALVWPHYPDKARIRYVETISSQQPFVTGSGGFFSKLADFLFGENKEQSWMVQPVGIAVGTDGVVFVSDPGAHGVHIFNREKKEYKFVSRTRLGNLASPVGLAVSADGTLYVSDSERGSITAFDENRNPRFTFNDHLLRPTGLLITGNKLYVTDTGLHKVLVFGLNGGFLSEFGGRGAGEGTFNYPVSLAAAAHSLYVVDALNYRVEQVDTSGKYLSSFGQQGNAAGFFASPKSVALDSDGDIYVTDALMDHFQIYDRRAQLLLAIGKRGENNGQFMSPGGIAIDAADNIYVVDMLNKRIQIFQYLK